MRFAMFKTFGLVAVALLIAQPSFASDHEGKMKNGAVKVDLKKSTFKWFASKKLGDNHFGKIFLKSAKATMKAGKIKSAEFVMDMKSFTVDNIGDKKWENKFLNHVKSDHFFLVDKHPTAKLTLKEQKGNKVQGMLTIRGKTHPVEIAFTQKGNVYSGKMVFDRGKYDVSHNIMGVSDKMLINRDVEINFDVVIN